MEDITPEEFKKRLIKAMTENASLSIRDIAHAVGTSFPVVGRWISGANAPAPGMRKIIIKDIEELKKPV